MLRGQSAHDAVDREGDIAEDDGARGGIALRCLHEAVILQLVQLVQR